MEFGATSNWSYNNERFSEYREYNTANGYKRFFNTLSNNPNFHNVRAEVKTFNNKTVKVEG